MEGTGNREQGTALARVLGIIGWIVLGSGLVFGQGFSAAISGVVRDASGAVVPEATVTARHTGTGLTRTTQSTVNGVYNLPSLPVGPYELTVEKPGFRQLVRGGLTLAIAQEVVLNLTLEVGQVQQTVEVTAEAPLVNTTTSSTSGLITDAQIKEMPLNGRSFEQLLTLNTGTVDNKTHGAGNSFSVAGKRPETNRFMINGIDIVGDNATGQQIAPLGSSNSVLGVDAVREYNVLQHTYGAEYGKRAGGQISVVTMSGTNQLHGTVFEYLRNSSLDARNFFDDEVAPFRRNQFGGSLGGPILRDKMFAFGNYEGFRERLGVSRNVVVPDLQARAGLLPCNVVHTTAAARTANCQSGLNTFIPVPNLAPGMLPFIRHYWPEPNGEPEFAPNPGGSPLATGTARYRANPSQPRNEDFGLARFDYNIASSDSLSTNFTVSRGFLQNVADNPLFQGVQPRNTYSISAQETHIFSPTVLNVASFGWTRALGQNLGQKIVGKDTPRELLLMSGGDRNNPGAFNLGGGTTTNVVTGIIPANGNNFHFNRRQNFTGSNDLKMTVGRHNLSLGVWFMKLQQIAFSSAQNNAGTGSYNGLLAFLQDNLNRFTGSVNPQPLNFRSTEAAWYFQDEIKLRPNLTVRLGLRDEMTTGWNEINGHAANYLFDANGVINTVPNIGRSPFVENNAIALWQPRVGVAWDPSGAGKWSVRAGFGIHNDLQDNLAHRLNSNPPFNARLTIAGQPLLSFIPVPIGAAPPPFCTGLDSQGRNTPAGCAVFAPGGLDPVMHTPTIQQWSLEIERAITSDLAVQVGYMGHQAYHVSTSVDQNTILPVRCENPAGCTNSGGVLPAAQRAGVVIPQGTEYIPVGTRPNRFVDSTQGWYYFGTSSYHALNLSLTKRARGGLSFKTNYTWSKILDINSAILQPSSDNDPVLIYNRANPRLSKGLGSYSLKHQFNTNVSYQLPFGKGKLIGGGASGWADKVIGGWQWNTIFNAQTGFPISPLVGANRSGNGDTRFPDRPNRNPNFTGPVILGVDGFKKTGRYFDPNAFVLPLAGTFGNLGRGVFRGPGLVNFDMSLFKRIPVKENWNVQFRAEAFNIFNHANLNTPLGPVFDGTSYSSQAGVITDTANRERQIQFALRLEF